jgi:16S rRNA C1402 N4-methylase RsmH
MTEYEDFESVFKKEVDQKTWRRIAKRIASLRAEINKRSHH